MANGDGKLGRLGEPVDDAGEGGKGGEGENSQNSVFVFVITGLISRPRLLSMEC